MRRLGAGSTWDRTYDGADEVYGFAVGYLVRAVKIGGRTWLVVE